MNQIQISYMVALICRLNGNHWGGQAEYLRVPYADSTSFVVPDNNLPDEKVLFLSDILPTAYWLFENAGVKKAIQL